MLFRSVPEIKLPDGSVKSFPGPITVAEVAQDMRVSTMTVYRLIKSGELAAVRVGKSYRIRADDLDTFLDSRYVETGS